MRAYDVIITGLLASLWLGYALLEHKVAYEERTSPSKHICWPLFRIVTAFGVVFVPLAFAV